MIFLHVAVSALHDYLKSAEKFGPFYSCLLHLLPESPTLCHHRLHAQSPLQIYEIWNWLKLGKKEVIKLGLIIT